MRYEAPNCTRPCPTRGKRRPQEEPTACATSIDAEHASSALADRNRSADALTCEFCKKDYTISADRLSELLREVRIETKEHI
jgi:hypothetical protein